MAEAKPKAIVSYRYTSSDLFWIRFITLTTGVSLFLSTLNKIITAIKLAIINAIPIILCELSNDNPLISSITNSPLVRLPG